MNYQDQLKHPNWQKKRLQILKRDKFTCKLCKDKETTLNVHHIRYSDGMAWEIENEYLITLCKHCHAEIEDIKDDENFDFNTIKIYKSNHWKDDSYIMFISYNDKLLFRTYKKDGSFMDGYNLIYPDLKVIRSMINYTMKNQLNE